MKAAILLALAVLAFGAAAADQGHRQQHEEPKREALLPEGLALEIVLQTTLDSRTSQPGQQVRALLAAPVMAEGVSVVPAGSELTGRVTNVSGPQMGLMKAKIDFVFNTIRTPAGPAPIEATVHLDVGALAVKGGKMAGTMAAKEVAKRAVPVLGTVFLIQDVAKAVSYVQEDKEIIIPRGTAMVVKLDKDARVPAR